MRLMIHATPNAKRNHVGGSHDGALRVSVTAAPDRGRANVAIRKLLSHSLGIAPSQLELISGATHRRKTFQIQDPPDGLGQQVAELMAEG